MKNIYSWKFLFVIILADLSVIVTSQQCNQYGFFCHSCDVAGICVDDVPTNQAYICSNGTVCNEVSEFECDPNSECVKATVPPTTTVAPNSCTAPGRFPDTTACNKYYTCVEDKTTGEIIKYEYTCPGTSVFDKNTSKCTSPENYDCLSEEAASTTEQTETSSDISTTVSTTELTTETSEATTASETTTPTTETTTPTTETTTPITETTTESTTEPSTSPKPFTCTSAGVFPNPTDCKTYYRCTQDLTTYQYTCPGTSTFNENTLKCTATPTERCKNETTNKEVEEWSPLQNIFNRIPSYWQRMAGNFDYVSKLLQFEDVALKDTAESREEAEIVKPFSKIRPKRSSSQ